jgi:iron complex outermembrane receptor protein
MTVSERVLCERSLSYTPHSIVDSVDIGTMVPARPQMKANPAASTGRTGYPTNLELAQLRAARPPAIAAERSADEPPQRARGSPSAAAASGPNNSVNSACRGLSMKRSTSRLTLPVLVWAFTAMLENRPSRADPQAETAPAASGTVQEVVVTAQRRAESLSNVPVSISAYDRAALDNIGARDVMDVARTMPGILVRSGFEGTTSIAIRGVSSSVGSATTGIYIDDTPIQVRALGVGGTTTSAFPRIFDLERVEVLRGPQGTLFGSGSEGGTIRFITPTPSLAQSSMYARSEIGFTDHGDPSYELGLAIGAPVVVDSIGFRASIYGTSSGGWINRAPYPDSAIAARNANAETALVANVAFTFKPSATFTITPAVYFQREHSQDVAQYWPQLSNPSSAQFVNGQLIAQPMTDQLVLPSLKLQWDLASATILSNTSYINRTRDVTGDYSFIITEAFTGNYTGPRVVSPNPFQNPQEAFTQEIRVQSRASDQALTWQFGAFYQESQQKSLQPTYSPQLGQLTQALFGLSVLDTFGVDLYQGTQAFYALDTSKETQSAVFGQVNVRLASALSLDVGLRVARSRFSFTNYQDGPFNGGQSGSAGRHSDTPVSPKIGLNYKPTADMLLYASAAKGFRSGGANTPVSPVLCKDDLGALGLTQAPQAYNSDSTWSYELGSKMKLANGRILLDGSVFYIDWKNIQSLVPLLHCGFVFVGNLGDAVSKGFDLQSSIGLFDGLVVRLGVGYTQGEFARPLYVAPGVPLVSQGDKLDTPPWHVSVAADYTSAITDGRRQVYVHAQYDYDTGYDLQSPNDVTYDAPANHMATTRLMSARLGLKFDRWDTSLFVDNALNSHDRTSLFHDFAGSELVRSTTFRPRTIGFTATYKY